jgi:hypothetical protein
MKCFHLRVSREGSQFQADFSPIRIEEGSLGEKQARYPRANECGKAGEEVILAFLVPLREHSRHLYPEEAVGRECLQAVFSQK